MKRPLIATLAICFLCVSILSCTQERGVPSNLRKLEQMLDSDSDELLDELFEINPDELNSKAAKAVYSLVLSAALDKHEIDIQSDTIIAPAVEYFESRGTAEHRLAMRYYRACVAYNAGNMDEAIEWLAKGESYVKRSTDYYTAGLLYALKSILYLDMYDFDSSLKNALHSSEMFQKTSHTERYASSIVSVATNYVQLQDFDMATEYLDKSSEYLDLLPMPNKAEYFRDRLAIAIDEQDLEYSTALKDSCMAQITDVSLIPWPSLSDADRNAGRFDAALFDLQQFAYLNPEALENSEYYLRLSKTQRGLGNTEEALNAYENFMDLSQLYNMDLITSDTRFTEERYATQINELKAQQKSQSLLITILVIALVAVIVTVTISSTLKRVRNKLSETELQYNNLLSERNALLSIQQNSEMMDAESLAIVKERLALLDKVLVSHISSDPVVAKQANKDITELVGNKEIFITSTTQVFSASHPKFIKYLKDADLTDKEIGFCCLYLMGMYSKDMEPYFSKNSSNNLTATIRKKIGLPQNGQKLKSYLMEKYDELG